MYSHLVDDFDGNFNSAKICSVVRFVGRFVFESFGFQFWTVFCNIAITNDGFIPHVSLPKSNCIFFTGNQKTVSNMLISDQIELYSCHYLLIATMCVLLYKCFKQCIRGDAILRQPLDSFVRLNVTKFLGF